MLKRKDTAHINAMNEMQDLMKKPTAMQEWLETKRAEFEALAEE